MVVTPFLIKQTTNNRINSMVMLKPITNIFF